jgi:tetratricopeptide (TPR) repeat protein
MKSAFLRLPRRVAACSLLLALWAGVVQAGQSGAGVADSSQAFDAANKFYEQGRFTDAAMAYQKLADSSAPSEGLYFNLGNAWFKAGQTGQAIAAWRRAERLAPRDPSIRFNLQFARRKVSGTDALASPMWQRALLTLTLNEWTLLTCAGWWLWLMLLALREYRPALRPALSGYTATAGLTALLLAGSTAAAADLRLRSRAAVVTVSQAIVRSGPLEEAKVLHQLHDGTELTVRDSKDLVSDGQTQRWLEVRDSARHSGWLRSDQVTLIP